MAYNIKCKIPTAADVINGIEFELRRGERFAIDVSEEVAQRFQKIPGYELVADQDIPALEGDAKAVAKDAEKTVGDATKAIADMTVAEIGELLRDHPAAWQDVENAEDKRDKPRDGVVKAVEQAKEQAQADD